MSERQRELIHDLRIELEETKAKLAASQGREAAMRAALDALITRWDADEIGQIDGQFIDDARAALATDGSGWVSPETVTKMAEALKEAQSVIREMDVGHAQTVARERIEAALAAFENSERGGK